MVNKRWVLLIAAFTILTVLTGCAKEPDNKWTRLIKECTKVMTEIRKMPDQGIPEGALLKAQAIAIFPNTISAGIGIGGQYGQGVILVNNNGRWSPPAIFTLGGGSIGWQIGGQATDIVLLFMDKKSVDALLSGKVKLGADASVAAGPVGRSASAATDIQLKGGILSYSRSRGLFIGIKLEGAVLAQHWDGNRELYGREISADNILIKNKVKVPRCARVLVRSLKTYSLLGRFM
ncbi:MAG: lipid-binding SYLF domain-containing protein [Candidatus Omnitrophota bacterium]|nr:lipid-binding SYLF domain-containing protein [Candidatus Omnitrophota bacterium]